MANVGACWARAGTLNATLKREAASERAATLRGGGAVSGRTENVEVVLSLRSRDSTRRARTGGDVLTQERLKEKEPERRRRAG